MNEMMNVNVLTMSSEEISVLLDSRHDKVKQSVDRLVERGVISQPPMVDGIKAANGVTPKKYLLEKRDSFIVVAQLSPEFTAKLVDRWQELELEAIQDKPVMDELEIMVSSLQHIITVRKEQKEQALRLSELEASNREVLARQNAIIEGLKFFTVLGYANLNNLQHLILKDAQTIGKRAAHLSRERNIPIDKVRDPRFGQVNAYAEIILNEIVAEYLG